MMHFYDVQGRLGSRCEHCHRIAFSFLVFDVHFAQRTRICEKCVAERLGLPPLDYSDEVKDAHETEVYDCERQDSDAHDSGPVPEQT